MSTEFGWWNKDPVEGKFQVHAVVHGGQLKWVRKQGHFTRWLDYLPTEDDWDRLMMEAEKRYVRRLLFLHSKQLEVIKQFRVKD